MKRFPYNIPAGRGELTDHVSRGGGRHMLGKLCAWQCPSNPNGIAFRYAIESAPVEGVPTTVIDRSDSQADGGGECNVRREFYNRHSCV